MFYVFTTVYLLLPNLVHGHGFKNSIHTFFLYFFWTNIYSGNLFIFIFLLLNYSCAHFPPITLPNPTHPHLPHSMSPQVVFVHGSFIHVPWWPFPFFPHYSLPPPLWLLSVCSLCQCLWFYFASLFVLFIRFHL